MGSAGAAHRRISGRPTGKASPGASAAPRDSLPYDDRTIAKRGTQRAALLRRRTTPVYIALVEITQSCRALQRL